MVDRAELERVRYVTAHFEILQGLTVLPVVAWCGLAIAWSTGWISGWVMLAATIVAPAATIAATVHYRRWYGQVRPRPGRAHYGFLLWPLAGLFAAAALVNALGPDLPISLEGLILSGGALAGAWFHRPLAPALLLVGLVGAATSLAPLGGLHGTHPLSDTQNWVIASYAGTVVLAGWGHILLRRTLGRSRENNQ